MAKDTFNLEKKILFKTNFKPNKQILIIPEDKANIPQRIQEDLPIQSSSIQDGLYVIFWLKSPKLTRNLKQQPQNPIYKLTPKNKKWEYNYYGICDTQLGDQVNTSYKKERNPIQKIKEIENFLNQNLEEIISIFNE